MKALGFEDTTRNEVEELVRDHDVQGTGKIDENDFIQIMTQKFAQRDPAEEVVKAFKLFDEVRGKEGMGWEWTVCMMNHTLSSSNILSLNSLVTTFKTYTNRMARGQLLCATCEG